jgi:hypothetical protein
VNDAHVLPRALPSWFPLVGNCIPPVLGVELKPRKLLRKLLSAELDIQKLKVENGQKESLTVVKISKFPYLIIVSQLVCHHQTRPRLTSSQCLTHSDTVSTALIHTRHLIRYSYNDSKIMRNFYFVQLLLDLLQAW